MVSSSFKNTPNTTHIFFCYASCSTLGKVSSTGKSKEVNEILNICLFNSKKEELLEKLCPPKKYFPKHEFGF